MNDDQGNKINRSYPCSENCQCGRHKNYPYWLKGKTYEEIYGKEKALLLKEERIKTSKNRKFNVSHKGYKHSKETKERFRQLALNRTTEHNEKLSLAKKGKKLSFEHKEKLKEGHQKHNKLNLPNCRCYVHGAAKPYMISSYTWKLADVLTVCGFNNIVAETQFGRYRVDTLLADEWLGWEADGNYHFSKDRREYDKKRDEIILDRFELPIVRLNGREVDRLYKCLVLEGGDAQ